MPVPVDNPMTAEKIELGRRLFFDKRLSRDGTVACASCHHPDKAFTDGRAVSVGVGERVGRRNAPTLLNCAYGKTMFWDSRATTLEEQALMPLTNATEMANTLEVVMDTIRADASYRASFQRAFGTKQIAPTRVAQSLATYQRTLVAANSPFDRYVLLKDEAALSESAKRGFDLFRGKARCANCHEGPLFTDQKFHNTGVSWGKEPLDLGRFEVTGREEARGKFKTPTLRHLTETAPYMHDGSIATLEDVIEFYNRGTKPNLNLDATIRPLNLVSDEKADLREFLKALSQPRPAETRGF